MSFDRRMRDAMRRISDTPDLDVETRLERALAERTTRPGIPFGMVLATVTAVLVVVVGLPNLRGVVGPGSDPSPTPTSPAPSPALAGVYITTLASDVPDPTGLGLAGTWSMTLGADLTLEMAPPSDFTGSRATGHAYAVDGEAFETDLWFNDLCDSIGRYAWSRDGANLTLQVTDDPCEIRRTVLGAGPWVREP